MYTLGNIKQPINFLHSCITLTFFHTHFPSCPFHTHLLSYHFFIVLIFPYLSSHTYISLHFPLTHFRNPLISHTQTHTPPLTHLLTHSLALHTLRSARPEINGLVGNSTKLGVDEVVNGGGVLAGEGVSFARAGE